VLVPGDVPRDIPTEALNPEDSVSLSLLAEYAFSFLPLEERRVVILHEFEGKPLRAIATMEKIVYSTVQARLKRGLARLQKANDEGTIGASFSAALGITGGAWSEPPPEIAGCGRRASTPPRHGVVGARRALPQRTPGSVQGAALDPGLRAQPPRRLEERRRRETLRRKMNLSAL
jgi:hypothetical protein